MSDTNEINRRRNQRPGNCDKCRAYVEAEAGYLFLMRGCNATRGDYYQRARGEWHVRCEACTLQTESVKRDMKRAAESGESVEMMGGAAYNISHACHGN